MDNVKKEENVQRGRGTRRGVGKGRKRKEGKLWNQAFVIRRGGGFEVQRGIGKNNKIHHVEILIPYDACYRYV